MAAETVLSNLQVQAGLQTLYATAVTPTVKLMGIKELNLEPTVEGEIHRDLRRSLAPGHIATLNAIGAEGDFEAIGLYDDIAYWLEGLWGVASPTGSGPYVRTYTSASTNPTPRLQTLVYGETASTNTYKATGVLPKKLTISGESGAPWEIKGDLLAMDITTGTLASLSDRTVTPIMGNHTAIYLDTWSGTVGTTLLSAMGWSFELEINTDRDTDTYLGSLKASNYHEGEYEATLTLGMVFNSTAKAFLDAILTSDSNGLFQRQVRIKADNGLSSTSSRIVQLDFAGSTTEAPKIFEERKGVIGIELKLDGTYNPTLGAWMAASITNGTSALA